MTTNAFSRFSTLRRLGLMLLCAAAILVLAGCSTLSSGPAYVPDFYTVTAEACYTAVAVPGTQRRTAQNEAEASARHQLLEYVGSMKVCPGTTVNDVMARDSHIRSRVLGHVRNAELVDWRVDPACGKVQVWLRVDLNVIRAITYNCY